MWSDKVEVKKGNYGEDIVRRYMEEQGWVVYEPKTNGPHAFDKLCVRRNKKEMMIVEVKTKSRMNNWYATGFNIKSYNEYKYIQEKYGVDVMCYFVDEHLGCIYGAEISKLKERYVSDEGPSYPMKMGNVMLFSLELMRTIAMLTDEQKTFLIEHSSRNYEYGEREAI